MRALALGVAGLVVVITGCGAERDLASANLEVANARGDIVADARTPYSGVEGARILGAIGDAGGLDNETDIERLYDDGWLTTLDLYALIDGDRRVMLQLAAASDTGSSLIQPGLGRAFNAFAARDGLGVGGLACVGTDSGDAEAPLASTSFDATPCTIAIDAEADESGTRVSVAAWLPEAGEGCRVVDDGDCAPGMQTGRGCAAVDLEDLDGDGDGDLAADAGDARATFVLSR
jgi:hypothetical protein